MTGQRGVTQVTGPVTGVTSQLPGWVTLVRAPNPGPMTLEGTNTWVIRPRGATAAVVVDPGPDQEEHLQAVAALGPVAGILITHRHPDHVAGLDRFRELTGAPSHLPGPGAVRESDHSPGQDFGITVIETPGHTADSVCFLVAADGEPAMLTGDTILGRGTTVVAWPDGNLGDYLASLARLASFAGVPVLPGHGPPLADCATAATAYLAHRHARLGQVRAAVAAGARTPAEVVDAVYGDLDPSRLPAAELTAHAQLDYLREQQTGATLLDEP